MKSEADVGFYTCTSQSPMDLYMPQEEHFAEPNLSVCALKLKDAHCSSQGHSFCVSSSWRTSFLEKVPHVGQNDRIKHSHLCLMQGCCLVNNQTGKFS